VKQKKYVKVPVLNNCKKSAAKNSLKYSYMIVQTIKNKEPP